jgi:plastocyanin
LWSRAAALAAAAWLLAGACQAPAAAYEAGPVADGGAIEGAVTFAGAVPSLPPIPVEAKHREHCGAELPAEALVVDAASSGVRYAVVYLEGVGRGKAPSEGPPLVLDNRKCLFAPHVLSATLGDTLRVRNADPTLHNIRARLLGETRSLMNVVQPTQGQETDREIRKAGVMALSCDAHPHMHGWLLAFEHPYHAVTDARGRFRLADVPPGRYRVVAWHEGWNRLRLERGHPVYDEPHRLAQEVEVPPSGTAKVAFEIKPR